MEETKHLKIETATHLFPKFTRMQRNVFDSCTHSYFARIDMGWDVYPTAWLGDWVGAPDWTRSQGVVGLGFL
jgi:hypothetical protein